MRVNDDLFEVSTAAGPAESFHLANNPPAPSPTVQGILFVGVDDSERQAKAVKPLAGQRDLFQGH